MGGCILRSLALVGLVVLLGALSATVSRPDSTTAQEEDGANIVLLMDHSYSLNDTDEKEFRLSAAQLFVELLDPDRDRVAIVTFAATANVITCPSADGTPVSAPDSAECFSNDATFLQNKIETETDNASIPDVGGTDLLAGLRATYELLDGYDRPNAGAFIILLTDGSPCDPGPPLVSTHVDLNYRKSITDEVRLNRNDASLYALSFSSPDEIPLAGSCQEPDRNLMEEIARDTGGWARHESSPGRIPDLYKEILTKIRGLSILDLERAEGPQVPPATEVLIAIVIGVAPSLEARSLTQSAIVSSCSAEPVESNITARRSCVDLQLDRALIVVLDDPDPGDWQFDSGGADTISVLAETKWGVRVAEPREGGLVQSGTEIPVRIEIFDEATGDAYENERVLDDLQGELTAVLLDSSLTVRQDSIELTAVVGNPAEFEGTFAQAPRVPAGHGERYFVAPQVTGLKFSRADAVGILVTLESPTIFTILQPPAELTLTEDEGSEGISLEALVETDNEPETGASVVVVVIDPDGNSSQVTLEEGDDGVYAGSFRDVGSEGLYDFTFSGTTAERGEINEARTNSTILFEADTGGGGIPLWLWILIAIVAIGLLAGLAFLGVRMAPRFPDGSYIQTAAKGRKFLSDVQGLPIWPLSRNELSLGSATHDIDIGVSAESGLIAFIKPGIGDRIVLRHGEDVESLGPNSTFRVGSVTVTYNIR